MREEGWVNSLAVVCLVLCWAHTHGEASTDCSPVGESTGSAVDLHTAREAQKHHLEVLFTKYGENGTISLEGLKRLLESVGLDRIRKVMVQHQEEAGHPGEGHVDGGTHHHTHQHHHHTHQQGHPHWQDLPATKKAAEAPKVQRSEGAPAKKIEDSDAHHNLYDKRVPQEISTTPVYTTNVLLKSQEFRSRRSADVDLSPDSASQGANSTHTDVLGTTTKLIDNLLVTEEQTLAPDSQRLDDQDHVGNHTPDHDHDHNDDHSHDPDSGHEHIPDPSHDQDSDQGQDPDHSHDHGHYDHNQEQGSSRIYDTGHGHDDHDHSHGHTDHKEEVRMTEQSNKIV